MTEKRFVKTHKTINWWAVLDNGKELLEDETVDILNSLYEENEQLKTELKDCHKSNHEYYVDKNKLIRLCEEFHIDWRKELEE